MMKLSRGLVLLAAATLAACSSGKPEGVVKYSGNPPNTVLQKAKFVRDYTLSCPLCGTMEGISFDTKICPKKKSCGAQIGWRDEYTCGSCKGTGLCNACVNMDQLPDGKCYNCKGEGIIVFLGKAKDCPNCQGKKVCPICEGSKKCDFCKGERSVSKEFVKAHLRKGQGDNTDLLDEKPAPKTEEKKTEEKKTDEKKSDEKPSEEKK